MQITQYLPALKAFLILFVGIPLVFYLGNFVHILCGNIFRPSTVVWLRKIIIYVGILCVILFALDVFGARISFDFSITYPPKR